MESVSYKAWVVEQDKENQFSGRIKTLQTSDLPDNDILIRVKYSSLNYKDALSASGNPGVTKSYPHTPGIDAAGIVEESRHPDFSPGEKVIVTSYDLGMNTPGGFGQYIRVPADWVVRLPGQLSLKESMVLGTAGFTAAMSVYHIVESIPKDRGEILVTGATGGVGSLSAGILSHLGYSVTAVSGKAETRLLKELGVNQIINPADFLENTDRPLLKEQWAGAVDTVGGPILAAAIKSTGLGGVVTCCGNVASFDLPINVFPFILRGVSLIGIDSQHCPMPHRQALWEQLAVNWKFDRLNTLFEEIDPASLAEKTDLILKGKLKGRTLVNMN